MAIEHGTDAWEQARRGNICCSELAPLTTGTMSTWMPIAPDLNVLRRAVETLTDGQRMYLNRLLGERLEGELDAER